jgi:protein TonB
MPSYGAGENRDAENKLRQHELAPEAGLLSYMAGESREVRQAGKTPRPARGKLILLVASAAGVVALMALPSTRQTIRAIWGNAAAAGQNWLNPKPAPLPQVAPQHDSFGQSGDEYKLPVAENIPDATTDPAQIRVVPVVDPTAKPGKSLDANGASAESPAAGPNEGGQVQIQEPTTPGVENGAASAGRVPATAQEQAWQPAAPVATQQRPALSRRSSLASNAAIPSSLRSQLASAAPELAGAKSAEATISSIEPVVLPEATAWSLLAQSVDPQYPAVARASGQRGSVILQVMVARDGTVQDAKFMQGSLVFARAAIDAVKQWHFKPYVMNERPVQVQSTITLNFKPPA